MSVVSECASTIIREGTGHLPAERGELPYAAVLLAIHKEALRLLEKECSHMDVKRLEELAGADVELLPRTWQELKVVDERLRALEQGILY